MANQLMTMHDLEDNNIVTHYQHGSVTKKSCFTNLLETHENWTLAVDSGHGVDVTTEKHLIQCLIVDLLEGYGLNGKLLT